MKRCLEFSGLVLAAGGILAICGCGRPSDAQTSADAALAPAASIDRVTAGRPETKTLQLFSSQPGRVAAFEETPLHSKLTGYVEEVLADIGDRVAKDQLLVRLRIPELHDELDQKQALLDQTEAEVKQAQAAVAAADAAAVTAEARIAQAEAGIGRAAGDYQRWQAEHARLTELSQRGSVTQKLVDETLNQLRSAEAASLEASASVAVAKAAREEARANVSQAQADQATAVARQRVAAANLAAADTLLAYLEIRAPFDGVVTRRNVDTGHYVHPAAGSASEPLLVVARTDKVRVFVDVPEMEAALVDGADKPDSAVVRVQSLGGLKFPAAITRTSWSLQASNRSLHTEIDIPNAEGLLRPGMYVTATILLEQRDDVLTLPLAAIVRDGADAWCCCVSSGRIDRRRIELGLRSGNDVEILKGLAADEQVVLARADALQPGQQVEVISPQP